jgi:hypothetical protein
VVVQIGNAAFQLDRLFVEVFEESAADGSEINNVIVPVIYGPRIVSGYLGFRVHVASGDTLSKIERERKATPACSPGSFAATPRVINEPNHVFVGQQLKIPIGV